MFKSMTELRFSNEDFHSSIGVPLHRTSDSISTVPQYPPVRPRVLVVEFRDEVYAGLKAVLEEHNCRVTRAEVGADVAGSISNVPQILCWSTSPCLMRVAGWSLASFSLRASVCPSGCM